MKARDAWLSLLKGSFDLIYQDEKDVDVDKRRHQARKEQASESTDNSPKDW